LPKNKLFWARIAKVGLIRKVPRANRYVLTEKGQKFSCSLMTASALDIKALTEMAA
jgi:predicted transcriptional regulator